MFGFNCIGYGIENAGWNHHWMFPGPGFVPMGHHHHFGYSPRVSDNILIGQTIFSAAHGVIAGLDAKYNRGANDVQAASVAFGTTSLGMNNALLGNMIDKSTGTYMGSMMNSTLSAYTNPFVANMGLSTTAMFTNPFMNPYGFGMGMGMGWGFYC